MAVKRTKKKKNMLTTTMNAQKAKKYGRKLGGSGRKDKSLGDEVMERAKKGKC
jgi:hypothetical protein